MTPNGRYTLPVQNEILASQISKNALLREPEAAIY